MFLFLLYYRLWLLQYSSIKLFKCWKDNFYWIIALRGLILVNQTHHISSLITGEGIYSLFFILYRFILYFIQDSLHI